ncbi:MAG: TrkH family potassium uptake protein [Flavobacteriales bacterium]
MAFKHFRESVNLWLYDNRDRVLSVGKYANVVVSLTALVALVIYYGFKQSPEEQHTLFRVIEVSFGFYILHYIVRIIADFKPWEFIKRNWFEGLLMFLLLVEGVSYNLFDTLVLEHLFERLGIQGYRDLSTVFLQLYVVTVVFVGLGRSRSVLPRFRLNPAVIFISSFLAIILIGTGLLMLPEMTTNPGSMNFLDAIFTSTSATCVTGLMVEDTPTFFTFKGQLVLLILIKLGGLNIIAFGSFLALAARFGLGVKQHDVVEDFVNRDAFVSGRSMLGRVVIWSTAIELVGAVAMFFSWHETLDGQLFRHVGDKVFYSLFHSVSAFNNAGISLFTDGLANAEFGIETNYFIHWCVTLLVFFGALGMVAIFDLFSIRSLRERMEKPWKQIRFPTKIALYFSLILVAVGAVAYIFLEYQGTLAGHDSFFGKITTAMFQSVTRTSGFNTVDIGSIGVPMLFLLIVLMFIGSSSSSTGGGIKTSTFAIIYADVVATIRGKANAELYKRTISAVLKSRAYSVLLFFITINVVCFFLLAITESHILATEGRSFIDLVFEEVSALGTVGLSTGITADLSAAGKVVIMASMFVGRVGTLTVAFALTGSGVTAKNYKYPEGHTMVG